MKVKEKSEKAGLKPNIQKSKTMVSSPINSWQIDGEKVEMMTHYFLRFQNHCGQWLHHEIKRCLFLGRKVIKNLDSVLKNRDITLLRKILIVKDIVFPVVMYRCKSLTTKKAWHQRTDAEGEYPILWPCDLKSQLIGKDPGAGKDWRQEGKGMTEDEMVGWHHRLDTHEFE